MRKLIFVIIPLFLNSCSPFSSEEDKVLEISEKLLENIILQRQNEIVEMRHKIDWNIVEEGDIDRWIYAEMEEQMVALYKIDILQSEYEFKKEISKAVKCQKLISEFLNIEFPFYEKLDSILINEWYVTQKENIVSDYAIKTGGTCIWPGRIRPFVDCSNKEIIQGQPFNLRFLLGQGEYCRIIGEGMKDNEIKYLPDSTIGKKNLERESDSWP